MYHARDGAPFQILKFGRPHALMQYRSVPHDDISTVYSIMERHINFLSLSTCSLYTVWRQDNSDISLVIGNVVICAGVKI